MATPKKRGAQTPKTPKLEPVKISWPFGRINYILFAIALAVIAVGYITLAGGSITLSPILLVIGYCVLIPIAIIVRPRKEAVETVETGDTLGEPRV